MSAGSPLLDACRKLDAAGIWATYAAALLGGVSIGTLLFLAL